MWKRKRKKTLFITAEIDQDGILGKINELEEIIEDMKFVLVGLKKDFHFKEEPTTDAGSFSEKTSQDI